IPHVIVAAVLSSARDVIFSSCGHPRHLHSFPTRRSSDLPRPSDSPIPMKLIVLTAPSGAGKTTLARRVMEAVPGLRFSISATTRSEEHTSELQSRENLVCRLLLEKKNITSTTELSISRCK